MVNVQDERFLSNSKRIWPQRVKSKQKILVGPQTWALRSWSQES